MSHYENIRIILQTQKRKSIQILPSLKLRAIPRQIINFYNLLADSTHPTIAFDYSTFGKMLTNVDLIQVAMAGFDINYFVDYDINSFSSYNFEIKKSQNKDFSLITLTEFYNTDWSYLHFVLLEEADRLNTVMESKSLTSSYVDALFDRADLIIRCVKILRNIRDNPEPIAIEPELNNFLISIL